MSPNVEETWLGARWLSPLLEYRELRLAVRRGRVLARKGWVRNLTVKPGQFAADVQNDSGAMSSVSVRMKIVSDLVWQQVVSRIAAEAALAADLLQGRVTERLASVFEEEGYELFPFDLTDLANFCNCREDSVVCTHAIATHFDFVRLMSADPTVLLEFRGRTKAQLISEVRASRKAGSGEVPAGGAEGEEAPGPSGLEAPTATLLDGFWERGVIPHLAFRIERAELKSTDSLPVVRALGPGPGDVPPEDVIRVLAPLLRTGRKRVDAILDRVEIQGDPGGGEVPDPVLANGLDEMLVAAAHQHGSLTSGFVAKALGISPKEARQYLQWLVEEGRLSVVGRARGTRYLPLGGEGAAEAGLVEHEAEA